jgi:isochorismate synthase
MKLRAVVVPAPRVPLERLLEDETDAFVFDGIASGLGVAREAENAEEIRAILASIDGEARMFGGMAFDRERCGEGEWAGFPAMRFVLPRVTYDGERLIFIGEEPDLSLLERLSRPAKHESAAHNVLSESEPGRSGYELAVEAAVSKIRSRTLEKVVLARSSRLIFDRKLDDLAVYQHLPRAPEGGLRFLFRAGGGSFVGSTPERLLKKHHDLLEADALAGTSTHRGRLDDPKTRHEQAVVVRDISERLASVSSEVAAGAPRPKEAGTIHHLYTAVRARAKTDVSLFDAARAIFPTPAVCGLPKEQAQQTIAESERFSRGWYAGAIGFVDTRGDGELFVALRCGLLREARAYLYAGAGIVEGSRASEEYLETTMKERVMLRALGAAS